jgi:DNA-binding beta-propeller fold protein YncE
MEKGFPGKYAALLVLLCGLFVSPRLFAQTEPIAGTDISTLSAREEFRIGVQAYNRYAFNEAILSFERALSFRPGEALILDWLGRAYYRSGLEETALRQWAAAARSYGWSTGPGLLLGSRVETVSNRRSLLSSAAGAFAPDDDVRYVEAGRFSGKNEDIVLYRQPTAVLPLEDGSSWVVAYGSNELVRLDVNGVIRERRRGPANGFDRPYDLVKGQGDRLYLSEYRGGRISVLNTGGQWQSYIGTKGRGDGQFIGPQNLAVDEDGYLYVVDYGNRRVSKFDPDGTFILSFGGRVSGFQGFLSPTGIAARNGRVYVADSVLRRISVFDGNGTYLSELLSEGLLGPESLRFLADGKLLAADTNRVILIDTNSAIVRELGAAGNSRVRIVGADMDRNGSILAANFAAGEVSVLTRLDDMASGLFVQIERVNVESFPMVTVDLQVQDRLRRPIVGLGAENFLLSEAGRAVSEQNFAGGAYLSQNADVTILMERSAVTADMKDDLSAAVRDINAALRNMPEPAGAGGGIGAVLTGRQNTVSGRLVSLVSAGVQPQRENLAGSPEAAARGASYSVRWRFDLGLRLAATDLLQGEKKRALIFVGSGELGPLAFEQYGLSELAAYMANNNIIFNAVIVGGGSPSDEIRYLCRETGGQALPLYRPGGIRDMVQSIVFYPSGSYSISYRSQLPTDFGRAYLPVDAEVYLMERSGRDGTGYFPPLE